MRLQRLLQYSVLTREIAELAFEDGLIWEAITGLADHLATGDQARLQSANRRRDEILRLLPVSLEAAIEARHILAKEKEAEVKNED